MNFYNRILLLFILLSSVFYSQRNPDTILYKSDFLEFRNFDGNNLIFSRISNRGDFNTATWSALNYGTLNAKRVLFDAGLWITGLYQGNIHSARKFYSSNYSPGPVINGRPAMDEQPNDSARYRVYKIFKGNDPQNPDLIEWPEDLGAPVDEYGEPKFYSDQFLWSAYNLLDTNSVDFNFTADLTRGTLPIEVQQKIYGREGNGRDFENIFNNIVFIEWTLINKGSADIDSAFVGLWCDIDFYDINSNYPAVDVARQTGYLWSGVDFASSLGGVPPAVGMTILYGPIKQLADSTAIFKGKELDGYYNLPLSSFNGIGDDSRVDALYGPPRTVKQAYNSANGYSNSGSIIIDPATTRATKFPFSGDPVDETGWLFPESEVGNGSGFILFSGPFDIAVNDTQWVMAAFVPALGVDKKESILKLREKIDSLKAQPYDSLAFGNSPLLITSVDDKEEELPQSLTLHQNYPNPFNPSTNIEFDIPAEVGTSLVKLSVYNILGQELKVLVDKRMNAGRHYITFDASDLPSGVYIYSLRTGTTSLSRKMLFIK